MENGLYQSALAFSVGALIQIFVRANAIFALIVLFSFKLRFSKFVKINFSGFATGKRETKRRRITYTNIHTPHKHRIDTPFDASFI